MRFQVNSKQVQFNGDPSTPLLWYLRDHLQLVGTKFGCGIGSCGACTVHVNGKAARSCAVPVSSLDGAEITTIEGLAKDEGQLHPVQKAWIKHNVPQCGYCQAGQIMAVSEFLQRFPKPTDEQIDLHLNNLCRCGTYTRMRQAIHAAASDARALNEKSTGGAE